METIKRGEDDADDTGSEVQTIILRVYESMGGHAQALLRVSGAFEVAKAFATNILEDELEELRILRGRNNTGGDIEIMLPFHGF